MMIDKNNSKDLSIYVHIPFCVKKCNYCDFLSMKASDIVRENYVQALIREIETESLKYNEYQVKTIFIGGGTPSLLTQRQIENIMHAIYEKYDVIQNAEISIEINPGTVTKSNLKKYIDLGINRLSIGLQSVDDETLKKLGRIHTYSEFLECYNMALAAGFRNINVDMMSALPGQSFKEYCEGLKRVLSLDPPPKHISAYSLILEEGTPFFERYQSGNVLEETDALPDEDTEREMYDATEMILNDYGFHRYEISNYAMDGYECAHNQCYWLRNNYVGFGIGAASMVKNHRWKNDCNLSRYLESKGKIEKEENYELSTQEQMEEFMFLGLRLMKGIDRKKFQIEFGISLDSVYGKEVEELKLQKLLEESDRIRLTKKGIDVSNYVFEKFLK